MVIGTNGANFPPINTAPEAESFALWHHSRTVDVRDRADLQRAFLFAVNRVVEWVEMFSGKLIDPFDRDARMLAQETVMPSGMNMACANLETPPVSVPAGLAIHQMPPVELARYVTPLSIPPVIRLDPAFRFRFSKTDGNPCRPWGLPGHFFVRVPAAKTL
jgi:hypothetical protein